MQGTKLYVNDFSNPPTEIEEMTKVRYASIVDSLMYVMVYMRLDIYQVVGVIS